MPETYSVAVTGKVALDFDMTRVKSNVSKLFKLNEEQVTKIFSGKPVTLRRGLSKEQAKKLRAVLLNAGALVVVKADPVIAAQSSSVRDVQSPASMSNVDITCPRCGHDQKIVQACGLCKMNLSLHLQRLKRRAQVRKIYQQRRVGSARK